MTPLSWAKLGAAALLLAGCWWHGHRTGAAGVQAEWTAADVARERATQIHEAQQRRTAHAAGERYEAQRAAIAAQATQARAALRNALSAPICPAAEDSHAPTLADLAVPAAAVQRLRDAAGPIAAD